MSRSHDCADHVSPIGLAGIADALGVDRNTVSKWRARDAERLRDEVAGVNRVNRPAVPPARWIVAGDPLWDGTDLDEWLNQTANWLQRGRAN